MCGDRAQALQREPLAIARRALRILGAVWPKSVQRRTFLVNTCLKLFDTSGVPEGGPIVRLARRRLTMRLLTDFRRDIGLGMRLLCVPYDRRDRWRTWCHLSQVIFWRELVRPTSSRSSWALLS
jgi:hypothetical protein